MKNLLLPIFLLISFVLLGCDEDQQNNIIFATSADYPPFEFYQNNAMTGFDIDLARLLAKEMKKEFNIQDMQFSSILASLQNGSVHAGISTITITEERKKNFDFSDSYYEESLSVLYLKKAPLKDKSSLKHKKIACQLGTTMEFWLKKNTLETEIVLMNHNNQAVEALKAGHVDGVLIDSTQAVSFAKKNPELAHTFIAKAETGYGIAVKKGSKLKESLNKALHSLKEKGELDQLKKKWLEIE